jgi:transaldolase
VRGGTEAIIGLGSSLGDGPGVLALAVRALDALPNVQILCSSRIYWSAPAGGVARHAFHNGAVRVRTTSSARGLLDQLKQLEGRLGRRSAPRWGDRVLDLDLLLFGQRRQRGHRLCLPHPGLLGRPFALRPAQEVAPDWRLPDGTQLGGHVPVAPQGIRAVGVLPGPGLAGARLTRSCPLPPSLSPRQRRSAPMKFFIDTANLDDIREINEWGILAGATTNPSLVAREGGDFVDTIHQICEIVKGPTSAETVSQDAAGMVREGRMLARVHEHVVVKVPMTVEGLKATRVLADDGIDVNVTLIFQAAQALLAAKAGARYVSPFLGRLDDLSHDGVQLIEEIAAIFENDPEIDTEILAASIRHTLHVTQVAIAGAHVATVPPKVIRKLVNHPLTDRGNAAFLADWDKVPDNDICSQVSRWMETKGGQS